MSPAGGGAPGTSSWRWRRRGQSTNISWPPWPRPPPPPPPPRARLTKQKHSWTLKTNARTHTHAHTHTHTHTHSSITVLSWWFIVSPPAELLTVCQQAIHVPLSVYLSFSSAPSSTPYQWGVRVRLASLNFSVSFICTKIESSSHSRCVCLPPLPPPPPPLLPPPPPLQWKWWWRSFESEG